MDNMSVGSKKVEELLAEFDDIEIEQEPEVKPEVQVEDVVEGAVQEITSDDLVPEGETTGKETKKPTLTLTPVAAEKTEVTPDKRMQDRLVSLREQLTQVQAEDDTEKLAVIMKQISSTVAAMDAEHRLTAVDAAFSNSFGSDYTPKDVFRSQEWKNFSESKRFGQARSELYGQAVLSNDVDAIAEIFSEFKLFTGAETEKVEKPKKNTPVTPSSNVASGNAAKPVVKRSVDNVIADYDKAIIEVMSGKMDAKTFAKIEAAYNKVLAA